MLSTPTKADVKPPTRADLVRLTGLEALARLPVEIMRAERRAGRNTAGFISGYEGSPLGGYDMELDRHRALLDEYGIIFQPGVNEELAATAVQGSQLASASQGCTVDGVIGFWYGKSPGLDRASDAFRHNVLMGVPANGGALVFVVTTRQRSHRRCPAHRNGCSPIWAFPRCTPRTLNRSWTSAYMPRPCHEPAAYGWRSRYRPTLPTAL
jgi:hypothetical protein